MKKAMTAIIACFFCMTCHAATEKRGDVVNFSLGKYGCTPNLDNSMVSANLAPSAMIDKSCINFQYNNSYFLPQIARCPSVWQPQTNPKEFQNAFSEILLQSPDLPEW